NRFDKLEREIRAEFQNLHRFLEEEEYRDLERLRRERQKQLKQLKEREKKIEAQGRDLERAITVLNSKLAEEDKVEANPRRFHYYYCLLGQQGFGTGRYYWEVEVGNKTAWRLGVAQEDVPRGEMTATGTSVGLWTLAFKGGSILACTDPKPTKINVSTHLVRIGVFLDCEGEEVTFYNAVTMAPIYTFSTGTVMVPLFPFFNPCDTDDGKNTAPITIFNPSL
ncbi:hypothetical protein GOODEAATRI_021679, partial [Goodea atripinnis]